MLTLESATRSAALVLAALAVAGPAPRAEGERPPEAHALLINGGQRPEDNAQSHLHHLQDMVQTLEKRGIPPDRIDIFSSDGEDPENDLLVRGTLDPRLWLVDGTDLGGPLQRADLTNTVWEGVRLRPATLAELKRWFEKTGRGLRPEDTLLIFVTDHGNRNEKDPSNGTISLWNETLSVLEFRALLSHLRPGVRVVNVMSQCFSGAFAQSMTAFRDEAPSGDVCGFYSTTADRPAYGCYPEGRDRDRLGHAFHFIDALSRNDTLDAAHVEVMVGDTTPDLPIRTTDLYLEGTLEREAKRRGIELDPLVDELLRDAFEDRGRWEPEIRLLDRLGAMYGVFSPRSLAEFDTHITNLESLSEELSTYRDRWSLSLDELRQDNLNRFVESTPEWQSRLGARQLERMPDTARKKIGESLLPELERYTRGRGEVWERLERLRDTHGDAEDAEYRVQIRLAALLRMRTILLRISGKQLLRQGDPALAALEQCERTVLGQPPDAAARDEVVFEALPPFEEDLAVVQRVLPSWFGIQFANLPDSKREEFDLGRGAVVVQQVYAGSAAATAGIEVGDFVVGPPGEAFDEPRRIREWIMSSPRHTPLRLDVLREGQPLEVTVALDPYPTELPRLPAPPKAGDPAPTLPTLAVVTGSKDGELPLTEGPYLLFFWATWCAPCKASIPEVLAWSGTEHVPVLALSDENPDTVRSFLDGWKEPFPESVATDELRLSYVSYGVSGTPTFVLIGGDGKITWRQTGYSVEHGLSLDGWKWAGP